MFCPFCGEEYSLRQETCRRCNKDLRKILEVMYPAIQAQSIQTSDPTVRVIDEGKYFLGGHEFDRNYPGIKCDWQLSNYLGHVYEECPRRPINGSRQCEKHHIRKLCGKRDSHGNICERNAVGFNTYCREHDQNTGNSSVNNRYILINEYHHLLDREYDLDLMLRNPVRSEEEKKDIGELKERAQKRIKEIKAIIGIVDRE